MSWNHASLCPCSSFPVPTSVLRAPIPVLPLTSALWAGAAQLKLRSPLCSGPRPSRVLWITRCSRHGHLPKGYGASNRPPKAFGLLYKAALGHLSHFFETLIALETFYTWSGVPTLNVCSLNHWMLILMLAVSFLSFVGHSVRVLLIYNFLFFNSEKLLHHFVSGNL